jgi:hypothetical protein
VGNFVQARNDFVVKRFKAPAEAIPGAEFGGDRHERSPLAKITPTRNNQSLLRPK